MALAGVLVSEETLERRPARIGIALEVLVRLDVQVLAAHRAETGAVRTAEDLVRELERDRVTRPGAELEPVVRDVLRVELVRGRRVWIVELARGHLALDLRESEAPHARTAQVHAKPQVEERRAGRLRDLELHGDRPRR